MQLSFEMPSFLNATMQFCTQKIMCANMCILGEIALKMHIKKIFNNDGGDISENNIEKFVICEEIARERGK